MRLVPWPLVLNQGFGNVLPNGRWGFEGAQLIADAINDGDWSLVEEYANLLVWDDAASD
jgi:hypothetical protein